MQQPMLVLESSATTASAAYLLNGSWVHTVSWPVVKNHASGIFAPLKQLIDAVGDFSPKTILVGAGPGSYGGIRVALAVADGLALVHGSQVVAWSSWNGVVAGAVEQAYVLSDARRGGWAVGHLIKGILQNTPEVMDDATMRTQVQQWAAAGIPLFSTETPDHLAAKELTDITCTMPDAVRLGDAWRRIDEAEQRAVASHIPEPLYVRPPHITPAKRPAWAMKS